MKKTSSSVSEDEESLQQHVARLESENARLQQDYQRVQEALRLRSLAMDAAANGISIADATRPDNPLIYVNDAFEHITGYQRVDVIGKNCRFLQGPDTDPVATAEIRAALREGRSCHVTIRNYRKDGMPFWNEFSIAPVYDENGTLTHFIGIQSDVTARKQAEFALLESDRRLSSIVDSAMDAIITIDHRHRIILFNAMAERVFGYTASEMIGKDLEHLLPVHARRHHPELVHSFGEAGVTNRGLVTQRVVHALRADGTEFPIEASISQVEVGGEKLYTVILRDISERLKAEEEQQRLQDSIISMQQALVQELSTPLIPLSDQVVVMPLVGSVDSLRAQNVMNTLLEGVEKNRARIAILDITGVPVVDTQVANTLIRSAQAVRLLGAKVLLTGIGPEIAQTLVGLGVDLGDILTYGSLQAGITHAMR